MVEREGSFYPAISFTTPGVGAAAAPVRVAPGGGWSAMGRVENPADEGSHPGLVYGSTRVHESTTANRRAVHPIRFCSTSVGPSTSRQFSGARPAPLHPAASRRPVSAYATTWAEVAWPGECSAAARDMGPVRVPDHHRPRVTRAGRRDDQSRERGQLGSPGCSGRRVRNGQSALLPA